MILQTIGHFILGTLLYGGGLLVLILGIWGLFKMIDYISAYRHKSTKSRKRKKKKQIIKKGPGHLG